MGRLSDPLDVMIAFSEGGGGGKFDILNVMTPFSKGVDSLTISMRRSLFVRGQESDSLNEMILLSEGVKSLFLSMR